MTSVLSTSFLFLTFFLSLSSFTEANNDGTCDNVLPVDLASCFFAVGGGHLSVETGLPQPQTMTPECEMLYEEYFREGGQYWKDTQKAVDAGKSLLDKEGSHEQMVILDVDETCLSNVPLILSTNFGVTAEDWIEWMSSASAPAIPATLQFYEELQVKGYSVVFLTSRRESSRNSTIANLYKAGFGSKCPEGSPGQEEVCYYDLIMRANDDDRDATVYKSEERGKLKAASFELIANVGDQWSDLLGADTPRRVIKFPNPLYYLP